jgi:hypothetical protein
LYYGFLKLFLGVCPLLGLLIFISESYHIFFLQCIYIFTKRERKNKNQIKLYINFYSFADVNTQLCGAED